MAPRSKSARLTPRKTPAQARSAETVRFILEGATRILESHGLEGFTTNAVAEKAGVSIGTLYQYFPNKDALTAALIRQETSRLLAEAAEATAAPTGREGLMLMIRAAVGHQMRRPALAHLLDIQEARLPVDDDVEHVDKTLRAIVVTLLACPDLPQDDRRDVTAADLIAMVRGMVDAAGQRGETDAQDLEQRVARAVFGYLGVTLPAA